MAAVDLALDLRPSWVRRVVMKLPLAEGDEEEKRAMLSGLDAIAGVGSGRRAA